ncbi:hypothetical protein BAOM_3053 [Peribacillus asahii]|uniref:Uncharacterized protein n=1 Tax=Peribacillus asahii TaxID=228899 RepID=A0A3Q9RND6_9BACI|nr:hypothetical protein [Peribacillus asahii]AZV43662.1 hypothetical protein BAOM_3053 [Peribacillus asahii]
MTNNKQLEAGLTESNEMVLVESRTMRDQYVYKDSVLDKIKIVPLLENTVEVTTEMIANYYEVPVGTIKTIISRNRDEFNLYGELRVLKGKTLKEFKSEFQDETAFKGASSLTLINRRGLLRIGMVLTESEVAQSIRNYLLNVEEISDKEQKMWAVEREISKRERKQLTDSIQEFYQGTLKQGFEFSTFTNLVYKVLFDSNAKRLREMYELDKNDPIRDSFTTEDLRKVVNVERTISVLIQLGKDYNEIKEELLSKKERYQ